MSDPVPTESTSANSNDVTQLETLSGKLPKVIPFSSLAACGDEIWIENNGQLYRLRRTSQGKLILTK